MKSLTLALAGLPMALGSAACGPSPPLRPPSIDIVAESDRYLGEGNRCLERAAYSCALTNYAEAVRFNPRSGHALTNLAWVLSTAPEAHYRDGARAIELADSAVRIAARNGTLHANLGYPVALAAAFAEVGDFDAAVGRMREVLAIARREGHEQRYIDVYQRYLDSYLACTAWRYSPP